MGFSRRTFYRVHQLWNNTGDVVSHNPHQKHGPSRLLYYDDIQYLLSLIRFQPDWFLDKLLNLLNTNRFISANYITIHRELKRAGVSRKKLKRVALERNEEKRNTFIHHISQYQPEELGFIDETSKNEKTPSRAYGRSKRGHRAQMRQRFVRGTRLSGTALLTTDGIVASTVVQGSMTKQLYLEFLENQVVSHGFFHLPHCQVSNRVNLC
jgi:transposase